MEDGGIGGLEDLEAWRIGGWEDRRWENGRIEGLEDGSIEDWGVEESGSRITFVSATHTSSGACARVFDGTRLCIRRWAETKDNQKTTDNQNYQRGKTTHSWGADNENKQCQSG